MTIIKWIVRFAYFAALFHLGCWLGGFETAIGGCLAYFFAEMMQRTDKESP